MAGLPPLSAEPGTPAHEWAAKTTSALDPNPDTPSVATMNPTTRQLFEEKNLRPGTTATETFGNPPPPALDTPGRQVPGAYPDETEMQTRGQEITQAMSQTASKAAETATSLAQSAQQAAATYFPKAAETVGAYLPKSVVDTVSSYVPGVSNPQGDVRASEHDKVHATSLPSTELAGQYAGEHTDGAGALPGPVTESEVSKLPDERNATVPTAGTMAAVAAGTAGVAAGTAAGYTYSAAQNAKQTVTGTAAAAKERVAETTAISGPATTKYSLPSEEDTGAKPFEHSDGAGALPGKKTEPAVATVPDENMRGATFATSASVGTHPTTYDTTSKPTQDDSVRDELHQVKGREVTGGVGRLPGMAAEQGVAVLPDERAGAGVAAGFGAGATSYPTRETTGAQPYEHSSGVGALPGKVSEQGVATLPDEHRAGELAGAGAAAAGMGKWALDERHPTTDKPSKVGEDTHLADSAKSAGLEEARAQPTKETQQAPKADDKHEQHKQAPRGKPNQVS